MDHLFDADTAVEAVDDHRYTATITDRWNGIGARPNGGYLPAVCLQALRRSEMTVHLRGRPAPGWLACRVATRYVVDGYHEEDFEIWDSAGRIVAQSRQLALLPSAPASG